MPLPTGYVTTAERQTSSEIKSNYFAPNDIEDNGSAELILCGVPDDHMIAGWIYWSEDGPMISRTEPDQAEWIANAKPSWGVKETKEQILEIINNATNKNKSGKASSCWTARNTSWRLPLITANAKNSSASRSTSPPSSSRSRRICRWKRTTCR